jgi:putative ABC transport system permease protein
MLLRTPRLRAAIRAVNPGIRIVSLEPLSAAVNRTLAPERLVSWLSMGFGIVALLLTSVGLYGILAYNVVRRTKEFGVRMALGAERLTIVRMVMTEAVFLVGIGLMLGLAAAVSVGNLAAKLLFGVQPRDTMTFASATLILVLVAIAAGYIPRASGNSSRAGNGAEKRIAGVGSQSRLRR